MPLTQIIFLQSLSDSIWTVKLIQVLFEIKSLVYCSEDSPSFHREMP